VKKRSRFEWTLGAGRFRLVRQFLTESLLLAIAGGAVGLFLAVIGVKFLTSLSPTRIPLGGSVHMDLMVLLFTVGVSCVTGLIFGLFPAIQISRPDLNKALKDGGRDSKKALPAAIE